MFKNKKTLKAIVLSLGLAAMMLPANVFAQDVESESGGGLLGFGKLFSNEDRSLFPNIGEQEEEGITNADFGEEAPLGSGIAILLGAGLGYVALKKKEDKQ